MDDYYTLVTYTENLPGRLQTYTVMQDANSSYSNPIKVSGIPFNLNQQTTHKSVYDTDYNRIPVRHDRHSSPPISSYHRRNAHSIVIGDEENYWQNKTNVYGKGAIGDHNITAQHVPRALSPTRNCPKLGSKNNVFESILRNYPKPNALNKTELHSRIMPSNNTNASVPNAGVTTPINSTRESHTSSALHQVCKSVGMQSPKNHQSYKNSTNSRTASTEVCDKLMEECFGEKFMRMYPKKQCADSGVQVNEPYSNEYAPHVNSYTRQCPLSCPMTPPVPMRRHLLEDYTHHTVSCPDALCSCCD